MSQSPRGFPNILGLLRATSLKVLGKPGATAGAGLAGATTSGAPSSGQFEAGDAVIAQNGHLFICTVAGSPGTWVDAGTAGSLASPLTTKGDVWVYGSADARLGVGSNNQVLTADSAQTSGLKWAAAAGSSVTTKGDLQGYDTAAARIPVGSDTQVLTADSTQALGLKWAAAGSGALTQISDQTVSGSAAASIAFNSLGSYTHLLLVCQTRSNRAANNDRYAIQFNGDTTSGHYVYEFAEFYGGNSANGADAGTAAQIDCGCMSASTSAANFPGQAQISIPNYGGTTFYKTATATYGFASGGGTNGILAGQTYGCWKSTAAITSILIYPANGSFIVGSRVTLYGVS